MAEITGGEQEKRRSGAWRNVAPRLREQQVHDLSACWMNASPAVEFEKKQLKKSSLRTPRHATG